jgi:hypothetical protein
MAKYIDTVKVGSTPTSVVLSEGRVSAPFSWNFALPENDPLHQDIIAEPTEQKERLNALPGAAGKKRGSKG